ncbi:MAG: condensation domain-containing protein [Clostridia bacterium]|nr:condensation domain-containing protein [Clostridia bacterium]
MIQEEQLVKNQEEQVELRRERDYWLQKLSGNFTKSTFPHSYKADESSKKSMKKLEFDMEGEVYSRLNQLAKGSDHSLYILFVTEVVLLLTRYTSQNDIIVGIPVAKDIEEERPENILLPLRNQADEKGSFKDLLINVKQSIVEALKNQNYSMKKLLYQLNMVYDEDSFPLFDVVILFENIHDKKSLASIKPNFVISLVKNDHRIRVTLEYNEAFYAPYFIGKIKTHFLKLTEETLNNLNMPLEEIQMLSKEELHEILFGFNDTKTDYPKHETIASLFKQQAEKTPGHTAVVFEGETITYAQLDKESDRLAGYLFHEKKIKPDDRVGILMDRSLSRIVSILGVLKSGGCYVPMDPALTEERLRVIIEDAGIGVLVSERKYIRLLNRLQWECKALHTFVCMDSSDIDSEDEMEKSELMNEKVWHYVAEKAEDDVDGGGWVSSYTGEPFSKREVDECAENAVIKISHILRKDMKVLEIGCATGVSMFKIAPKVGLYYGTDLSSLIIERNKEKIEKEGYKNIRLQCLQAHEMDRVEERNFDLVFMNSVVQCFHGHNYLRKFIREAVDLLGENGHIFIGDVMDQDLKEELLRELKQFKINNRGKGYKTKTDFSTELFLSREFFEDLKVDIPGLINLEFSKKIYSVENELTKFRYDVLITVDKKSDAKRSCLSKNKYRNDLRAIKNSNIEEINPKTQPGNLAYVIYTSGSTGKPKGTLIKQFNVVRIVKNTNYIDISSQDRILQWSNYAFDGSVFDILGALLNGAGLVIPKREDTFISHRLADILERERISVVFMTTAFFNTLVDLNIECLRNLRKILFGGERVSFEHAGKAYQYLGSGKLVHMYGPTETTVFSTFYNINGTDENLGTVPIGKPVSNTTVYILDHHLNIVPVGVSGEIYIGGDGVGAGYLNNAVLTREKFVKNPHIEGEILYKTGDYARWLPDGNVEFLARKDDQVKIRGFRIELGEIKNQILKFEGITDAVLVVIEEKDKAICAYFTAGAQVDLVDLKSYLSMKLPEYMVPAFLVQLDKIPLNANGKINKDALPLPENTLRKNIIKPRDGVEKNLAHIWAEVLNLKLENISIDDNFFDYGGHSLKASIFISKIYGSLGMKIPLDIIFKMPTIMELSGYVKKVKGEAFIPIGKAPRKDYYVLSPEQTRYYSLQKTNPVNMSNNVPWAWTMEGKFDIERLNDAINLLIERHESLRTYFKEVNGEPVQIVLDQVDFSLDFMEMDEAEAMEQIRNSIKPFDLSKAPILRGMVIKVGQEKHILFMDMHHIICDGTSIGIMFKEINKAYNREELPEVKVQYQDFAQWLRGLNDSDEMKKQMDYWHNQFKTIPVLNMPTDFERPKVQSFDGDTISRELEDHLYIKLKDIAKETRSTLYIVMLAAFNILLHKYTGDEDIIVGSPISGRRHPDFNNTIGLLINMIGMRNYPSGEKTYAQFLEEVKKTAFHAYENQDYKYEELIKAVLNKKDPSRNPLFDVVFVLQNMEIGGIDLQGLKSTSHKIKHDIARIDIFFQVYEIDDCVKLSLEYATALFKRDTARKMLDDFSGILKQVVENMYIKIEDITLVQS